MFASRNLTREWLDEKHGEKSILTRTLAKTAKRNIPRYSFSSWVIKNEFNWKLIRHFEDELVQLHHATASDGYEALLINGTL